MLLASCSPTAEVLEWVSSVELAIPFSLESGGWVHDFPPVLVREEYVDPSFGLNVVPSREESAAWPRGGKIFLHEGEKGALSEIEMEGLAYAQMTDQMNALQSIDWSNGWRSARAMLEARGISPIEFVVGWVQDLPYQEGNSHEKYPVQTFLDRKGDCSDKTMLAMDVLHRMGFRVGVIVFAEAEHMGLAVACEHAHSMGIPKDFVFAEEEGLDWVYVECTVRSAWGEVPSVFANGEVMRGEGTLFHPAGTDGEACTHCLETLLWQKELQQMYGKGALRMSLEDRSWWQEIQAMAVRIETLREGGETLRKERDHWLAEAREMGCVEGMTVVSQSNACSEVVDKLQGANNDYNRNVSEMNLLVDEYNENIVRWNQHMKR